MERYESKQLRVERPAQEIYERFSRMDALTPFVEDKVEAWQATEDTCSFRAKGFPVSLRIAERDPGHMIRVVPEGSTPFEFAFQIEFREEQAGATFMKFVLDIALNPMMKMMMGGQIQKALDSITDTLAEKL